MKERSKMVEWLRGELIGPSRPLTEPETVRFTNKVFVDPLQQRRGPLAWSPVPEGEIQEVLYYERESPHRKYGSGLLHPSGAPLTSSGTVDDGRDTMGADPAPEEVLEAGEQELLFPQEDDRGGAGLDDDLPDELDVTGPDVRQPSVMGVSLCVRLEKEGRVVVRLPIRRVFSWQEDGTAPFPLNGRYEKCKRRWTTPDGQPREADMWRRMPAVLPDVPIIVPRSELESGKIIQKAVAMNEGSPIRLQVELLPRRLDDDGLLWLITIVLRNCTTGAGTPADREAVLYQSYFEVAVENAQIERYPESQRPFSSLDSEEQSLMLLYRESATWAIGHGCAAAWDADPGAPVDLVYADVLPAVELPSMTPDIEIGGRAISLSMRQLSDLTSDSSGPAWKALTDLARAYGDWIETKRREADRLPRHLADVARRHIEACETCLERINSGMRRLKDDSRARTAFRLANLSMLLQQIATKQLRRRPLEFDPSNRLVVPSGAHQSPWQIYTDGEESKSVGSWRAFQIAFLLMSLDGVCDGKLPDREMVDLIWFPTGGGKTEAYLAVMAFYMFHERLLMGTDAEGPRRDGTNILMRYTLRMLTTQQFQRAASLVCAMEFLRRNSDKHELGQIPGRRFSLGLWIGGEGSPNSIAKAQEEINAYRTERIEGNPLILTECPWCRSEIGRFGGTRPRGIPEQSWRDLRIRGISNVNNEGHLLLCSDGGCTYGGRRHDSWLPVEVIDERIYRHPPSLVISTTDKLAMIAYRPEAGALFGRIPDGESWRQTAVPPGLIVQDELHLISGPLGTMYALYEGIIEQLCSFDTGERLIRPKLIASTATIRGVADQVRALYARVDNTTNETRVSLFPCPGLNMGDSFFGKYARDGDGRLKWGRLYLGIHGNNYGSILTTQVRAFSTALFRSWSLPEDLRDPWWTLLAFYNSLRELGGAKTLFDSDIRSRLKFMFNRENFQPQNDQRRTLKVVEELTSRLSQADIVKMMDRLAETYDPSGFTLDGCLASNIIEVGVDIDRLSLMGVVGQPKTTATYIQVTGRVGRRWWERPGLILTLYSPGKSRDRSHYEQFHGYHRRLYERVEPTTATPFALSAIQRALPGALITWARQHSALPVHSAAAHLDTIEAGYRILEERCRIVQSPEDVPRSLAELERMLGEIEAKWGTNPQMWEEFPPKTDGEYLMLWPGQHYETLQKRRGLQIPSSMRQVDSSAELTITQGYADAPPVVAPNSNDE